tara:strand:- start:27 stop:194 length:168 start_codon:yes stop_codon:yes gene_type:complete
MTPRVEKYLKKADAALFAAMTGEEQRFIERQGKRPKKKKPEKVDDGGKGNESSND